MIKCISRFFALSIVTFSLWVPHSNSQSFGNSTDSFDTMFPPGSSDRSLFCPAGYEGPVDPKTLARQIIQRSSLTIRDLVEIWMLNENAKDPNGDNVAVETIPWLLLIYGSVTTLSLIHI